MKLYEFEKDDRIGRFFTEHWGSNFIVSGGEKLYGDDLPGFAIIENGQIIALLTYHVKNNECEIVSLDSLKTNSGNGTRLIKEMVKKAQKERFARLWLMTTNDNIDSIRFYQKRGFVFSAVYPKAIEKSRQLKQTIPEKGFYAIPIRDEIEFEFPLD